METIEQSPPPLASFRTNPAIRGDPATRKFAIFFLATLASVIIGVGIGIGVGNIAHYRYFPPTNQTFNVNYSDIISILTSGNAGDTNLRQVSSLTNDLKTRNFSPKLREFWLSMDNPDRF